MRTKTRLESIIAVLAISFMLIATGYVNSTNTVYAANGDLDDNMVVVPETSGEVNVINARELPDSDEALGMYIDELAGTEVFAKDSQAQGKNAGSKLTGQNLFAYNYLKAEIERIAAGELSSTQVDIPVSEFAGKTTFVESELGIQIYDRKTGEWIDSDTLFDSIFTVDFDKVMKALLADCPYDLYWYEKTKGTDYVFPSADLSYSGSNDEVTVEFESDACITVKFIVANAYRGNSACEVDVNKTSAASETVDTARDIVEETSELNDYGKLTAYKDIICELTEYNWDAVKKDYAGGYGDPWQLIYVFDGDDNTKVVCEGYSKAFKLLCDMTDFDSDAIYSKTVSGDCGGAHMWNVVTMDDNKNYIADITNTDGWYGDDAPFLVGASGSLDTSYAANDELTYKYDKKMFLIFSNEELEISGEDYVPEEIPDYDDGSITDIQLNLTQSPIEITEGTNRKLINYLDEDTQDEYQYYKYDLPRIRDYLDGLTVTFENGISRDYEWDSNRDAFTCTGKQDIDYEDIFESIYTDQNYNNEWKGGETHSFTVDYMGKKITVPVVIKHVYVKKTIAAKVGVAGKKYDECTKCGATKNVVTIKALNPAKTTIKSLSKGKKSFTVKWTKKAYTGYQIRYSTKSSMSGAKTVTVTKSSTVSKTVKNLKAKKKYYVQIRTYKTVSGKKYYSAWSTKKSVTTK